MRTFEVFVAVVSSLFSGGAFIALMYFYEWEISSQPSRHQPVLHSAEGMLKAR